MSSSAAWATRARGAALAALIASLALSCSTAHPCFGPRGSWKPYISVVLFGDRWSPQLVFDDQGRSSLFWEDNLFYATEKCGALSVAEKNDLFSAWEAAFTEPVSTRMDGIAAFYSPSRQYVLGSVEELDDKPLLREAVVTTLRIGLGQYGGRLRKFIESHPLGALDVTPGNGSGE